MKKVDVIKHFQSISEAATALSISQPAISKWGDIVPEKQAMKLHLLTDGQLKYDPALYAKNISDSVDISHPQVTNPADAATGELS